MGKGGWGNEERELGEGEERGWKAEGGRDRGKGEGGLGWKGGRERRGE